MPRQQKAPAKAAKSLTAHQTKLLNRVIDFYSSTIANDRTATAFLTKYGITDYSIIDTHKIGFSNGSLLEILPDDKEMKGELSSLGILNDNDIETFLNCITAPICSPSGNVIGLVGFHIQDKKIVLNQAKSPSIFNLQAFKNHDEVIMAESFLDALAFLNVGFANAVCCFGEITDELIRFFLESDIKRVILCGNGSKNDQSVAATIKKSLESVNIDSVNITFPDNHSPVLFFKSTDDPKSSFEALISQSEAIQNDDQSNPPSESYTATDSGFTLSIDNRTYDIKGIKRGTTKLKTTIKGTFCKQMHVDTVDLYSSRSRSYLIKGLSDLFGDDDDTIKRDLERITELAETYNPASGKVNKQEMTAEEREQALAFLKNPEMFTEILEDFETTGYTGEETNKLLCYIAAVSRKIDSPLSVMIQSRSAAGKSTLQDAVLQFIPEEETIKYTRLTDQALFYKEASSLKHKILAIEELDGMNGAIYSIRSIQSSKKITIAYTGKDPVTGKAQTEENTVEGPLMVFITTTQVNIDGETASRFVFLSIDESEAMTQKIHAKQREAHTMEGLINKLKSDQIIRKHQNANRLLKPLHVLNPYANLLTFTSKSIRARRDHTKYLNLILAIAYLFQYQREIHTMEFNGETIEYINVTLDDIEKANLLANEVFGRTLDELTPPSRSLLKLIREMVTEKCKEKGETPETFSFTRRDIREYSGWSDFQVKTHIKQLEELEYIYPTTGKKGKTYVYELVATGDITDDKPFMMGLTDLTELKDKAESHGILAECA